MKPFLCYLLQPLPSFFVLYLACVNTEETLKTDSVTVLKLIELQHGLLVERARGIYSFSHLLEFRLCMTKRPSNPECIG